MAEKDIVNIEMNEIRKKTNALLQLETDSKNLSEIKKQLLCVLSLVNKLAHPDEKEFLINELKKKGYPLENYVQWCLAGKGWHIQANTYFYDKDEKTGRELDIKAWKPTTVSTFTDFCLNLYIQCKKLPGNAWIFFSAPQDENVFSNIKRVMFADYLDHDQYLSDDIFKEKGTHFDKCDVLTTNHCEVIVDKREVEQKRGQHLGKRNYLNKSDFSTG